MKKRLSKLAILSLVVSSIICGFNPQPAMAATTKDKAISAYNKFMASKSIKWGDSGKVKTSSCQYHFINVDNNSVPEMLVTCWDTAHTEGNACLYTYENGKVKFIDKSYDGMEYYNKKGIYTVEFDTAGYFTTSYMKLSGGKKSSVAIKYYDSSTGKYTYENASNKTISYSEFSNICSQYGITSTSSNCDIAEASTIKNFLRSTGVEADLSYRSLIFDKSPSWSVLKNDMAVTICRNKLNWESISSKYNDEYVCYSNYGTKYNSSNLATINSTGKGIFGNKFNVNFKNNNKKNSFYFLAKDKAYIFDNRFESGDLWADGQYSSIYKTGSTYVVKYTSKVYVGGEEKYQHLSDSLITIKLKKTKSGSFYIKKISWTSRNA